MEEYFTECAKVFKAFCDENRLRILNMLQSGEKCACVLLKKMNISQPTLSHHMRILVESGVVFPRKEGKWTYYSINTKNSERIQKLLRELIKIAENPDNSVNELCCIPERNQP